MAPARLFARYVRVLVACVALGVLAAPPPVATQVDAVTWIASARTGAVGARTVVRARASRTFASLRARAAAILDATARVERQPAGVRSAVVRRRIYLRHAALLC